MTPDPVAPTPGRLGSPGTGVLVTGGASGIGRATALALAEVGRPAVSYTHLTLPTNREV